MNIDQLTDETGIYAIKCKVNSKIYVGSTINSFKKRIGAHFNLLKRGEHHSKYLQNAFYKHGEDNFEIEILEVCEDDGSFILEREQYYIDKFGSANPSNGFNECPIAGNSAGRKFSEEAKVKMSEKAKGHKRCVGRKLSEETKRRISESNKGNQTWLGRSHSEQARKKMSKSQIGNKNSLGRTQSLETRLAIANKRSEVPITESLVRSVYFELKLNKTVKEIADEFKITRAQVYSIKNKWAKKFGLN